MKVLLAVHGFPPELKGGTELVAATDAAALARSGCEVVVVTGTLARAEEIDGLIAAKLAAGWTLERLDKPMKAILRVGTYELLARADVPGAAAISEYVDVAKAFYDKRESGFVNGLLDGIAKQIGR